MRPMMRAAAVLLVVLSIPARGQWTALGDMPRPTRQGNALRFENAQAVAVVTALSAEVIRVSIARGGEGRDHSYAVVNRDFGDPGATVREKSGWLVYLKTDPRLDPLRAVELENRNP